MIQKKDEELGANYLWQIDTDSDIDLFHPVEKTTLIFGVFYLDKFSVSICDKLNEILKTMDEFIEPWRKYYPWNQYSGPSIKFDMFKKTIPYLVGSLCVDHNVNEEESLMVAILYQLSKKMGPHVFIKICDSDGDFLLMECNDLIPKGYEFPVGNNRLWLNEGKFKLIPISFHPSCGLKPNEVLSFLQNFYFKCIEDLNINSRIRTNMIIGFPERFLRRLVKFPITLSDHSHFELIKKDPKVLGLVLENIADEGISVDSITKFTNSQETLTAILPLVSCNFLAHLIKSHFISSRDDSVIVGGLISNSINNLINKKVIDIKDIQGHNKLSSLKQELECSKQLKPGFTFDNADFANPEKINTDVNLANNLNEKLYDFFFEMNDTLDGIKNKYDDKYFGGSSEDNSEEETIDKDQDAQEYLKQENIDIDEDDFFEFFLTDALKLKDEELNKCVANTDNQQNELYGEDSSDEEHQMLDELNQLFNGNLNSDADNLEYLFKSLEVDGATNGPLQTIIRNMNTK